MVEIQISYEGKLCCSATHEPSGAKLFTDAPRDNHGEGQSFSPTDLVATALGTCLLTIMGIVAQKHDIDLSGATVHVTKEMATAPIRRIGKLAVQIRVPRPMPEEHQRRLREAAMHCPVQHSLHPDVQMPVSFEFGA